MEDVCYKVWVSRNETILLQVQRNLFISMSHFVSTVPLRELSAIRVCSLSSNSGKRGFRFVAGALSAVTLQREAGLMLAKENREWEVGNSPRGLGCAKTWCIEAELYWTNQQFLPHITLCVLLNFYSCIHACLWFKSKVSQSARGPIRGLGSIIWASQSVLHSLWLFSHTVFISDLI